jgi:hypothetical protein
MITSNKAAFRFMAVTFRGASSDRIGSSRLRGFKPPIRSIKIAPLSKFDRQRLVT